MLTTLKELTRALRGHDSCLFAQESKLGRYDVYRASKYGEAPPHYVFSLTEDWTVKSRPVPWGTDIVLNRLKAHDLWRDDTFVEQWIKANEAREESQDRARRNSIESFLYDFRSQFHRATNDINTSCLGNTPRKESHASR